jgi:hypothetical protein
MNVVLERCDCLGVRAVDYLVHLCAGAPKGFHLNKADYFLRDGTFVPKGSKWVRNRSRNPLNPRALQRAVARVDAGKTWQGKLHEIETGKYTKAGNRKTC